MAPTPGWKPVDIHDPKIQDMARASLKLYNDMAKTNLVYDRLESGEFEGEVAPMYRFILWTTNGQQCDVMVFNPYHPSLYVILASFNFLKC